MELMLERVGCVVAVVFVALMVALGLLAVASPAAAQDPLGWHSPDVKSWEACETTVYVTPDGKTVTPGPKSCPASFSRSRKRGLRTDGWRTAATVDQEFAYVEQLALQHVPAVRQCDGQLKIRHEAAPALPGAYVAVVAGEQSLAAGTVVNGYYIGPAPDPEHPPSWETCVIVVRDGTPVEMCDRLTHELYHDAGFKHGDAVLTMAGEWVPACRDDAEIRMMERFHEAFEATSGPCRALSRLRIECRMRPGRFTMVWERGAS